MCDIGKIKQVTFELAPSKAKDIFQRMLPAEKVFRPLVPVKVIRRKNEDRVQRMED
jgi:hypothetical protein